MTSPRYTAICTSLLAALASSVQAEVALEEVVVTAQLKQQSLQDVPIAITALGADALALRSANSVLDLESSVPNINIARNTGTSSGARVFMRGIGEDDSRITQDPAVGIYVDDVYLGRQTGSLIDLVEVERVEVLRGPQGTLYGRNTNAGAIRIVTRRPTQDAEMQLQADVGSDEYQRYTGLVSGGLTDTLSGSVSLMSQSRDGFIEDTGSSARYGDLDKIGGRAALNYEGDNWNVLWSVDFLNDDSDPGYPVKAKPFDDDGNLFTISQSQFSTAFPNGRGEVLLGDFFNELEQRGTSLHISGSLSDDIELTSITGWRTMDNELLGVIGGNYYQDVEQEQVSQELRLSGIHSRGDWVGGVYFYQENAEQVTEFIMGQEGLDLQTDSAAVFGQVGYDLSDAMTLTAGARYTWEEKTLDATLSPDYWYLVFYGPDAIGDLQQDETWSNVSWRLVLDYQLADAGMLYGSVTNGFKSGGWSSDSLALVDEETVFTYELGYKVESSDRALRLNTALFFNQYDDLQLNGVTADGGFSRVNAGDMESYGVEFDLTWRPLKSLEVSAYGGYLDGEYTDVSPEAVNLISEDTDLKLSPRFTYGIGVTHYATIGGGELVSSVQLSYADEQYVDVAATDFLKRDATNLVNARIAYSFGQADRYTVALWGKNLLDEEYHAAGLLSNQTAYPGDPLTWGASFQLQL